MSLTDLIAHARIGDAAAPTIWRPRGAPTMRRCPICYKPKKDCQKHMDGTTA